MAEFVLNRNLTLRSLTGHSVAFVKGQPTYVPDAMIAECSAVGAERVDAKQGEGFDEEAVKKDDPTGIERTELLYACFDDLIAGNKREHFTAQGAPHIKAIKEALGFTVDNKERDKAWADYRIKKGSEE